MTPRSFLFVPGDSTGKMLKASTTAAHALVLDLEDSVAHERLNEARGLVLAYLSEHRDRDRQQVWVRINPLDSGRALQDLSVVVAGAPDGVLLPKCESGAEIARLAHYLDALEVHEGVEQGSIKIIAVATETAASVFELGSYKNISDRLYAITWGAEDLATALAATTNKDDDGELSLTYQMARSFSLLGARAAGIQAIDTINADFRDLDAIAREVQRARKDGFTAKFAIHPAQIAPINDGYTLSPQEVAHARAIVSAFRNSDSAGTLQLDGKMIDKPHLTQALQMLAAAGLSESA